MKDAADFFSWVCVVLATLLPVKLGILLTPAAGAAWMSLSTVIVAVNARFLKVSSHG